jgi:alpha-tubulin suppressor-like RCC1 family protein
MSRGAGGTTAPGPWAAAIAVGDGHACALIDDGMVRCWGSNSSGQLGDGSTVDSAVPVAVVGLTDAVGISAERADTCVVARGGTVRCWGGNINAQLGDGSTNSLSAVPVTVSGIANAAAISVGGWHSCAVLRDGTVRCWGGNQSGQLGDGTTETRSVPVTAAGITNAVAVGAGSSHTCAVIDDGTIRCWGSNGTGQLGQRSATGAVRGINDAAALVADSGGSYALLADGTVECWGVFRRLGVGTTTAGLSDPVLQAGFSGVIGLATTGFDHGCAVLGEGRVRCWGWNTYGQLGNGQTSGEASAEVSGIEHAAMVDVGGAHSCAVLRQGTVRCWGGDPAGTGPLANSSVPVTVDGL